MRGDVANTGRTEKLNVSGEQLLNQAINQLRWLQRGAMRTI